MAAMTEARVGIEELRSALRRMVDAANAVEAAATEPCTCGDGDGYGACGYCEPFVELDRAARIATTFLNEDGSHDHD